MLRDPRAPWMRSVMNLKIKFRDGFRPFAPSILREHLSEYFELDVDSPYMLLVAPVRAPHRIPMSAEQQLLFGIEKLNVPRSSIPAVTHVDYSARIQTVHAETEPHLPRAPFPLPRPHRLPRPRQHQLQRARRADRVHAAGRLPLLHADGDG